MADPLARHEDRQLDVQLDLAHLEGRGVPVAHEVADEAAVAPPPLAAAAVGDARRLHDGLVVAHVVDHADETVVEHRHGFEQELFQRRDRGAPGGVRLGALLGDVGLLLGRDAWRLDGSGNASPGGLNLSGYGSSPRCRSSSEPIDPRRTSPNSGYHSKRARWKYCTVRPFSGISSEMG